MEVERKCPKLCSNEISEVTFRNFVKGKFDDIIDLKDHLGIGDDYRNEAWGFLGSLFFVITTTATIGKIFFVSPLGDALGGLFIMWMIPPCL